MSEPAGSTGLFLYGVVPSDVEPEAGAEGIGAPPGQISVVRQDDLAVLVSDVRLDEPVGSPADLTAYQRLLDGTATVAPVLPVRFGTVMSSADGVEDWLRDRHEQLTSALDELDGRLQYTVHGRFDEQSFLSAFLAEDSDAASLAEEIRGVPETQSRQQRIQLGEMISKAVEQRRQSHNQALVDALSAHAVANAAQPPSHEMDAVNVAWLIETDAVDEFVQAVEDFAEQRRDLIRMRLLGPLAPYDFVTQRPMAA
jgi:hypothetical protein